MQETRTLNLFRDTLDAIQTDNDDRLDLLQDELENNDDLESMLGSYHDSGQVTYTVDDLEVDEDGCGYLEVGYTAHKYSGCRDMDLDEEGEMRILINIDFSTGRMTVIGEKWPDRDPDEY
jgi:hypothetical protein